MTGATKNNSTESMSDPQQVSLQTALASKRRRYLKTFPRGVSDSEVSLVPSNTGKRICIGTVSQTSVDAAMGTGQVGRDRGRALRTGGGRFGLAVVRDVDAGR